jgi:uncharacterized membrane protein (UPF0182 family)
VLVNYGDRVGYANTFAEALDQVFGAGAGDAAADSGSGGRAAPPPATSTTPAPAPSTTPAPSTAAPPATGGGTGTSPAMDAAVKAINDALTALANATRAGDFAAIGKAQSDLQAAVTAYQAAQAAQAAAGSSSPASPTG